MAKTLLDEFALASLGGRRASAHSGHWENTAVARGAYLDAVAMLEERKNHGACAGSTASQTELDADTERKQGEYLKGGAK